MHNNHSRATSALNRLAAATAALQHQYAQRSGDNPSFPGRDWLKFVPEGVRGLVRSHLPAGLAGADIEVEVAPPVSRAAPANCGQFLPGTFTNASGTRPYRLYVPSGYCGRAVPLVVMLHGCTQSPDDFAAGTQMNDAAEARNWLVLYPGQPRTAHPQKCWKWFSAEDQGRGHGEPSIIAGMTRQVMRDYAVDRQRVFVAGLSAGGAAAAIMGEAYPELYAAVGVHSGLACGAAQDLPAALTAMKQGNAANGRRRAGQDTVPTIVFHGDRDTTVSPRNGTDVLARSMGGPAVRTTSHSARVPGGHTYEQRVHFNGAGHSIAEEWTVRGLGHAWSGGSASGSYTDPHGPDATAEMLRFFDAHPGQPAVDS